MERAPEDVTEIFEAALELPAQERPAFLASNCDAETAQFIAGLLQHHEQADQDPFWHTALIHPEAPAADPSLGEMLGPYRLESLIAKGGMGRVYRAVRADAEYRKLVAIKRIKRGLDADEVVARFRAERQILSGLEHPNIARLIDGGTDSLGLPYLVMEYVEGEPLLGYLRARPGTNLRQRLTLFRGICEAVHYAHQRMVIHRDLKPGNILVTADGTPKLLDFGIAKLLDADSPGDSTTPEDRRLTPAYASPEQIRGQPVTSASDVYSLGVILFEMLTGRSPYKTGGTHAERMAAVCEQPPQRLEFPEAPERRADLDRIVLTALAKDPARRYASVAQLSGDVQRYLERRPILAQGDSLLYTATRFLQRHKLLAAAALLLVLSLTGGIVATRRAQARAERRFRELQTLAHSVVFKYSDAIKGLAGATPVQQMLTRDALDYLDRLAQEAGNDAGLLRDLTGAYSKISQVQGDPYHDNLGDTNAALATSRKAIALGEQLVREDPSQANLMALADANDTYSNILSSTGDLEAMEQVTLRTLGLYERIEQARPQDFDTRLLISETLWGLGDLNGAPGMGNLGRSSKALDLYRRSLAIARDVEARQKPVPADTAMRVFWTLDSLALMELALGHTHESQTYSDEALARISRLVEANPENVRFRSALSLALDHAGRGLLAEGNNAAALRLYRDAESRARAAMEADPKNVGNRRKLGIIDQYLSLALRKTGALKPALGPAREGLQLMQALAERDPANADFRSDVSIAHRRLAEALLDAGERSEALPHAVQSVQTHRELSAHRAPKAPDSFLNLTLARALLVQGDAQDNEPAIQSYREAQEILEPLSQRDAASAMLGSELARSTGRLAAALQRNGQTAAALEASTRARALWNHLRTAGTLLPQDFAEAAR